MPFPPLIAYGQRKIHLVGMLGMPTPYGENMIVSS